MTVTNSGHILILALLMAVSPTSAQESKVYPDATQEFKLTANAELVLLDVGVKDPKGGYVSDLKKENFKIYENGKLQTISDFASEDVPVTVGLVIDNSGSMQMKRPEVIAAALAFIHASNPNDEVFVTNFNDRVSPGLPPDTPFSDDPKKLQSALATGRAEGKTALYDALLLSLQHLEAGKRDKKTLVLVSDGGDNASTHTFKDLMPAVRRSRATIYSIGIFDESDPDSNPGLLRRLAGVSGGEAFFPKELPELTRICRQIAKDIRNRYTIGYVPVRADEKSALRTIKLIVTTTNRQKLIIHARTSYLLPESSGMARR